MASFQNFRSAFNGFNREDVVRYLEMINNKHNAQVNQLNTEIQALYADIENYRACSESNEESPALLQKEQERSAALEQELAAVKQQLEQPRFRPQTESELEAYRRAARAERAAHERVNQLYARANGALADATARTDETAMRLSDMAGQISAQLSALQTALTEGANTIRDAAATMYTIKPVSSDE